MRTAVTTIAAIVAPIMTPVFDDAWDAGDSWTGEVDAVFGAELVEAVVDPCVVETEAGEDDAVEIVEIVEALLIGTVLDVVEEPSFAPEKVESKHVAFELPPTVPSSFAVCPVLSVTMNRTLDPPATLIGSHT